MANVDRPRGATPVSTLDGSPWSGKVRQYAVDSSNGTAIFVGDFITLEDDGNVTPASAGGILLGVCVGVVVDKSVAATEHPGYLPASTAGNVLVAVGPDLLFEIQEDSTGGAMPAASIGSTGNIVAGAGSTTTGRSAHELDSSDVIANDASPTSAQLLVVDYARREDNTVASDSCKWIVKINESAFVLGQAGL